MNRGCVAIGAIFIVSLMPAGIVLLGNGLSGGDFLSISAIFTEIISMNPAVFLRILGWISIAIPVVIVIYSVRLWSGKK